MMAPPASEAACHGRIFPRFAALWRRESESRSGKLERKCIKEQEGMEVDRRDRKERSEREKTKVANPKNEIACIVYLVVVDGFTFSTYFLKRIR